MGNPNSRRARRRRRGKQSLQWLMYPGFKTLICNQIESGEASFDGKTLRIKIPTMAEGDTLEVHDIKWMTD